MECGKLDCVEVVYYCSNHSPKHTDASIKISNIRAFLRLRAVSLFLQI